ncbi:hypothetical protein PLICRDRAFT_178332 [Plicaturopsis crispa FD-325 SS-3]|nr:hypothetical protein PLICRDRAFT_178332 [Plicaturopsis crispa FD-325 SS-3]
MAQAVYDDHPLEAYLREVGEVPELMPGGFSEFAPEDETLLDEEDEDEQEAESFPQLIARLLQILRSIVLSAHASSHSSMFAERFKYDVISSNLLSTTFATPLPGHRRPLSPPIPIPGSDRPETPEFLDATPSNANAPQYSFETFAAVGSLAIASSGHIMLGVTLLGLALVSRDFLAADPAVPDCMTPTLEALKALVAAGNVWDSSVHEAITILESEERSIFYGPITPSSPSSSLRVALHSSLNTSQTQCDNVRQLFSALTSPTELSQLSEMYAPPSPAPSRTSFTSSMLDHPRPISHPGSSRVRTLSTPADKRSTWNGSYSGLALAGQLMKPREKRRSDLSSLLDITTSRMSRSSMSAPPTPAMVLPEGLGDVQEEETGEVPSNESEASHFGASALELRRKRRTAGLEALGMPQSAGYFNSPTTPLSPSPSPSKANRESRSMPSSRFTMMQTTRHPLSLSALNHALQGAIASKRYACSHLLALRFEDADDEGYWEDVRSVMSLLTSTFVDASSRLTDALEEAERKKLRDGTPSPSFSRPVSPSAERAPRGARTMSQMVSFAPMPSHLTRFAAHVDTISSALNDARENLEQCVASLREEPTHRRSDSAADTAEPPESAALQAYERLRRELGLALRECERGRERLLDIVAPPKTESEDDGDDVPALAPDVGSEESDKQESATLYYDLSRSEEGPIKFSAVPAGGVRADDATAHLLREASEQHLPPQGIEQVFEADPDIEGGVSFSRERSKLSREERIRLMKLRRESGGIGLGLSLPSDWPEKPARESWGPGGEVVQELKDVIWQVGEKRRKLSEGLPRTNDPFMAGNEDGTPDVHPLPRPSSPS